MERWLERGLFASRWLMAPFYVGLVLALAVLLFSFLRELAHLVLRVPQMAQNDAILGVLSLIDLSLAGNLLLIVIFAGYENFVSQFDLNGHKDKPEWQGATDFSVLKLKLISSIIAISAIDLLEIFMNVATTPVSNMRWMVIIHLVFLFSGVMLALMDKIASAAKAARNKNRII